MSRVLLLQKLNKLGFDRLRSRIFSREIHKCINGNDFKCWSGSNIDSSPSICVRTVIFFIYVNYVTKDVTGPWAACADDFKPGLCYPRGEATK